MPAIRCICNRFVKNINSHLAAEDRGEQIIGTEYECKCGKKYISYSDDSNVFFTKEGTYLLFNNKLEIKPKEEKKMSFFNYNPNEAGSGFDPLPAGEYEVIISEAKVTTFASGSRGIKVTLTVRDDVDQEGGKRKVFENFVETPAAMFKFHNLAKGLEWAEGDGADTLEEFAEKIQFAAVRVKLKVKAATAQYAAGNDVVTYLPTQAASHSGGGFGGNSKDPFYDDGKPIDISDDDLPF